MVTSKSSELKGYQILERIGTGGFGEVYRANQSAVGREVAIKVILPELANQPEFIRRFEAEARLIAKLEHLHIVPLYDYWRDPEGAYLVMRMLKGGSLRDAIDHGSIGLDEAALILDQVSGALAAVHRYNVVHRDIKPSNVLLDEDGNAYLTDFGIAKDLKLQAGQMTQPDSFVGSPDYIAPEQARNEELTPQTDIYSLGVLIYEILTGEHPFAGTSTIECIFKHINEPLPQITGFEPDVNEGINTVIQKATQKNPNHRYKHVLDMAKAFREAACLSDSKISPTLIELLTPREQQVLIGIIEGKSNRQIANELVIEVATVKWYVKQIYRKLNVRSRVQAIVRARELNLIVDDFSQAEAAVVTTSQLPDLVNPYKGLRPFEIQDEEDFYGREKLIQKLLERLMQDVDDNRFLAIVGPSGSGKSSLIKAGLIPAVWRGEIPDSEKWFIVDIKPGPRPIDELEIALTRISAEQGANIGEHLSRNENGLLRAAELILPKDNSELLVVIDQFEEIFTLVEDEEKRKQFLELLTATVKDKRSRVRVVITLRADFYDRPLQYAAFGNLIRNRVETVLPLSAVELEQAIVQPAHRVGVVFEEGLVSSIIDDVLYQPGGLPLLEYALTELFEERDGRRLTHEAYHKIGGAVGALGKRAEELYQELSDQDQKQIRQAFMRLVTLGEGTEDTRRVVPQSELLAVAESPDRLDEMLETFANYRLLSMDTDPETRSPTVQVAHEALLREWKRLREWLKESRDDIRFQQQMARSVQEWEAANKEESFLLRGARLEQFDGWYRETNLVLTASEIAYLNASLKSSQLQAEAEQARREKERRLENRARRVLQAIVGVMLIAALVSGLLAVRANNFSKDAQASAYTASTQAAIAEESAEIANQEAEARAEAEQIAIEERQQALVQAAIGLAGQAQKELAGNMPQRAVPLALEALENYPYTWQAQRALAESVFNHTLEMIIPHESKVTSMMLSADQARLLTGMETGKIQVADALTGEVLLVMEEGNPYQAVFSPDNTLILSIDLTQQKLQVWDAVTGELNLTIETDAPIMTTLYNRFPWSPDSKKFVIAEDDGTAAVWDAATGDELLVLSGHEAGLRDIAWSPDGAHIVTASFDNTAILWDAQTGESIATMPGTAWGWKFGSWSADGSQFALRGIDIVSVFNSNSGEEENRFLMPGVWSNLADFSPDSKHILTIGFHDGIARIWNTETGEIEMMNTGNYVGQTGMWSPSGGLTALGGDLGIFIWDTNTGLNLHHLYTKDTSLYFDWNPEENLFYAGGNTSEVRVFRLSNALLNLPGKAGWASEVAWSPDGSIIARGYQDGSFKVWRADTGGELFSLQNRGEDIFGIKWSPDGEKLLVVSTSYSFPEESVLSIWDMNTGELLLDYQSPYGPMMGSEWSPDGSRVVIANYASYTSEEAHLTVWDVAKSEEVWSYAYAISGIYKVDWSPDGTMIAAGTWGDQGGIFDAATGELLFKLFDEDYSENVYQPAFSPDSSRLAVFSAEKIWIFDTSSGELLNNFAGSAADIDWSLEEYLVTADWLGAVRIYDVATGAELMQYDVTGWPSASLSPDSTKIGISSQNGELLVYPMWRSVDELIAYAKDCCMVHTLTPEEREVFGLAPTSD